MCCPVEFDDDADPDSFYPQIIRLIVELADEDTLAILRPETGQINLWSDDVFETLVRPQGHDEFSTPTEVPVIPVEDDDPLMTAAVEEARSRWPEFAEKFESRGKDDSFSVKAAVTAGGNTEFIWMNVIGLEPEYIHGELANEPIDLGDLKLGSRVEVSLADLNDWAYQVGEEEPQGLFTVKAITEAQKRFRES